MIIKATNHEKLPQTSGVYIFRNNRNEIIYIGKAINLKNRVSSYFRDKGTGDKSKKIALNTALIELIEVSSEFEALLIEAKLIRKNKPKYNVIWRDDKSYLYVQITHEEFPRVLTSRKRGAKGTLYGPFPSGGATRDILKYLRVIFPFCVEKMPAKRVCFYHHLGLCRPCPVEILNSPPELKRILKRQYLKNIGSIKKILLGDTKKVIRDLTAEMVEASKAHLYEEAALQRDRINNMGKLMDRNNFYYEKYLENPLLIKNRFKKESESLTVLLRNYFEFKSEIKTVECFDISNISGKFATGSLVTFVSSLPEKSRYRHFRIKTLHTPNDFEMLREVFNRRFKHTDWPLPDLIMVDGGTLQLDVLIKTLQFHGIKIPAISLAKRLEEVCLKKDGKFVIINLPENTPALNLLKRIRNESHRFALRYHQKLRLKYLLDLLHK